MNKEDHTVSNEEHVLTAQNELYPKILAYNHDPATGAVENRRIFALVPKESDDLNRDHYC